MSDDLNALIFAEDSPIFDANIKKEIKRSVTVKSCSEHTHIFVLATHAIRNKLTSIEYKEKSTPIAGYTYDAKFCQYYVDCVDFLELGTIPISFSIRISTISRWECRVPLTESIIKKYLDEDQKKKLRIFKQENKNCRFEFMQLVSCY